MSIRATQPAEAMLQDSESPNRSASTVTVGQVLRLYSRKYDGSEHYTFDGRVVDASNHELLFFVAAGTPLNSYRGAWRSNMHMLCFYWTDRYYNLCVSWYPDWRPRADYVNIATPATWTGAGIHVIDLDLDLIRRADDPRVVLDDADEFEQHRQRWHYPEWLVQHCREAAVTVAARLEHGHYPFDVTVHHWARGITQPTKDQYQTGVEGLRNV